VKSCIQWWRSIFCFLLKVMPNLFRHPTCTI